MNAITTPSIFCSAVRKGRIRSKYQWPVFALNLAHDLAALLDNRGYEVFQIGDVEADAKVADRPADVSLQQAQQLLCGRCEAADTALTVQNQDGKIDAADYVVQIVGEQAQLGVALLQLLVEGDEFFIARLKFFLGGLEFFVRALKLLHAGECFLVGGFQLLVGGFLLANDRLNVFPGARQFAFQPLNFRSGDPFSPAPGGRRPRGRAAARGAFIKQDEKAFPGFAGRGKRVDLDIDCALLPIVLDRESIPCERCVPLLRAS